MSDEKIARLKKAAALSRNFQVVGVDPIPSHGELIEQGVVEPWTTTSEGSVRLRPHLKRDMPLLIDQIPEGRYLNVSPVVVSNNMGKKMKAKRPSTLFTITTIQV